jgi:hypothetical protein
MSDIHPIVDTPTKPPISPVKGVLFVALVIASLAVGYVSRGSRVSDSNIQVLGEETRTLQSYLPDGVRDVASRAAGLEKQIPADPHAILDTGRELAASAAGKMSIEAEKAASQAAQTVTDYIYKNTIERLIRNLILALPENRQKEYLPQAK